MLRLAHDLKPANLTDLFRPERNRPLPLHIAIAHGAVNGQFVAIFQAMQTVITLFAVFMDRPDFTLCASVFFIKNNTIIPPPLGLL
jgi:hypothetical protein